ncbi:hypothetical protein Syun_017209 [Stephania yunnanensis]|uniref:Uncharacterized protein n=1 Tax=Stephania yunnanensis TaxID=152371 RepID=A0AAP0J645_9MAGN
MADTRGGGDAEPSGSQPLTIAKDLQRLSILASRTASHHPLYLPPCRPSAIPHGCLSPSCTLCVLMK